MEEKTIQEKNSKPAPSPEKTEPGFWELFDRTIYLCLRVGIVISVCGFVMWYGFYSDQKNMPAESLIDPYDQVYTNIQKSQPQREIVDPDPIFKYPQMQNAYNDIIVLDGVNTYVGSFETHESPKRVLDHYTNEFTREGLNVTSSYSGDDNKQKTDEEHDWTMTGVDEITDEQYLVRIQQMEDGGSRVNYSKSIPKDKSLGPKFNIDPNFPEPAGQFEVYKFQMNPGELFGSSCQYFSDTSVDVNFRHFIDELIRRGWRRSDIPLPTEQMNLAAEIAMFRRAEFSLMLSVAPSEDEKWLSVISLTIF